MIMLKWPCILQKMMIEGLLIWRWTGPVKRAGSPRWDDFYPTFTWILLSQLNHRNIMVQSKSLLCRWKKIVWSSIFYNKVTWSHYAEQMFLYCLINLWKVKQKWLKKMLSHLAGLVHLRVFIWKIFISPRWDPGKIKWDPT